MAEIKERPAGAVTGMIKCSVPAMMLLRRGLRMREFGCPERSGRRQREGDDAHWRAEGDQGQ